LDGALPKKQEEFYEYNEEQSVSVAPVRSKNQSKKWRKQEEGPVQDWDVLPFAFRSLYRVVVRITEVEADTLIVPICMDLLLSVHSEEESLRYFPDLTDAESSEQIIKQQGLTIFVSSSCTIEQLRERFMQLKYVAGVSIIPIE